MQNRIGIGERLLGIDKCGSTSLKILGLFCVAQHFQGERLEAEIDAMNGELEPLRSFILPGGSELAAYLHLCRTVSRRAERHATELAVEEEVNPAAVKYLNRLSDWFFVAARIANDGGRAEILWGPGQNR